MNEKDKDLFDAVATDDSERVKRLLGNGANPNSVNQQGDTPLHLAVRQQYTEVVRALLNSEEINPNAGKNDGWTPLMESAFCNLPHIAKILLENDAKPNIAKAYGWTALMEAAYEGHAEVVKALLQEDANPNAALKADWTALSAAKENGNSEVIRLLEEAMAKERDGVIRRFFSQFGRKK